MLTLAEADPGVRMVLIEGLPGSGKSSLADWLRGWMGAQGIDAAQVPEVQADHPVIDRRTMRTARDPGYAARCIGRWKAFATALQARPSPRLFILEGCLFQSTVRLMVEYQHPSEEIEAYLPAVERCLAPLGACLVYLAPADPTAYLEGEMLRRKGEATVSRIAAYSATTPFAVARSLAPGPALVALYTSYRQICDRLVARSRLPVLEIDAGRLGERAVRARVGPWVTSGIARGTGLARHGAAVDSGSPGSGRSW